MEYIVGITLFCWRRTKYADKKKSTFEYKPRVDEGPVLLPRAIARLLFPDTEWPSMYVSDYDVWTKCDAVILDVVNHGSGVSVTFKYEDHHNEPITKKTFTVASFNSMEGYGVRCGTRAGERSC